MTSQRPTFSEFLEKILGQKEVSLIVAKDDAEEQSFREQLTQAGFKLLERPLHKKVALNYVIVKDPKLFKEAYDFAAQSPLGQIQLWDESQMKTILIAPDPMHPTVFLLTKDTLVHIRKTGLDILSKVGLTYQS